MLPNPIDFVVGTGGRFGPAWARNLAGTDLKPVPMARAFDPGSLGPVLEPFTSLVGSKPAQITFLPMKTLRSSRV